MVGEEYLPKKIKFVKVRSRRNPASTPAISVPLNERHASYINRPLRSLLKRGGVKEVEIMIDTDNSLIALQFLQKPTITSYSVNTDNIQNSNPFSVHLGEKLPRGKYLYDQEMSQDEILVFKRIEEVLSLIHI